MKPIRYFLSRCLDRATPSRLCRCTAWGLVVLGCIAFATTAMTCSHTREGLEREQAVYSTGTNVVSHIQTLVPYLPPPVSTTAEVVLAVATALLAAWNTAQHRTLRQLQNGKHPPAPSTPSATPAGNGL